LIENISTQLHLAYGIIPLATFVHIQRIAQKGFQSIRIIEDNNIEDPAFDIDPLITELFAWGFELKLVGSARLQPQAPPMVPPVTAATGSSAARVGSQPPTLSRPTAVASVRPANIYRS
jgi:hypothetical protein